jgi:hypothetical protein
MPGRIRTIKPEWLDDQRLIHSPDEARVLSVALLLLADDYGNGRCDPDAIATRVFPASGKSLEDLLRPARKFQAAMIRLVSIRFAGVYELDDQRYFTVRNWDKHQKVNHPSKPLVPGPPDGFWEQSPETLLRLSGVSQETLLPDHDHDHDHEMEESQVQKPGVAKPKKPKAEKVKPLAEPERTGRPELIDHYFAEFERRRGSKPCFGSREGKAANEVLDAVKGNIDEAKSIVTNAYDSWWGDKFTILDIAKDPSKFRMSKSNGNQTGPQKPLLSAKELGLPGF